MISIKNLDKAEPQEVFDFIYQHLKAQSQVSQDSSGSCLYRNAQGLKCAAGCLIADDEYTKNIEHQSWADVADFYSVHRHTFLISKFQVIHDGHDYPSGNWVADVRALATKFELTFNE